MSEEFIKDIENILNKKLSRKEIKERISKRYHSELNKLTKNFLFEKKFSFEEYLEKVRKTIEYIKTINF